ncbi:MAG: SurA N-terminal domain-containing protein [Desulfovibrio sp.]|nr:SurA N-terminal domain-containing protein [Desulfovibrio sp.]
MLDIIRSNTQSFGVKIAFAVIILVFVFWGVGTIRDTDMSRVVAKINGEPILIQQFEKTYRNAEERMMARDKTMTRDRLKAMRLGRQVLNSIIQETLVMQEAVRTGLDVSPQELRLAIGRINAFQNDKGQFDPEVYKRVLAAQRMSPAEFEHDMRTQILREKMFGIVATSAWVSPTESRETYDFLLETRGIDYAFMPASNFADGIKLEDSDIAAYYDSHKDAFAIPAKVSVDYIRVAPELVVKPESVSEADAKKWYEENKAQFERKEAVKASHILVRLDPDADDAAKKAARESMAAIQAELKAGKSFAEVANAHNPENAAGPGGELGWVERGRTVRPFEEAAFALAAGSVTAEPVVTEYGLHLIKVDEKRAGGTPAFTEVAKEAAQGYARDAGREKLADVVDGLIEDNILGKPMADIAARFGLKVEQSGLLSREELKAKLGVTDEGARTMLASAGIPIDTALEAGDSYLIVRVGKSEAASVKKLDDVRDEIKKKLVAERSLEAALKAAADKRKELKDGPVPDDVKKSLGLRSFAAMQRGGSIEGFLPNKPLNEAVFMAKSGVWLPTAYAVMDDKGASGAMLVRVASIAAPKADEWEKIRPGIESSLQQAAAEGVLELFVQQLGARAKIELLNSDIVDRVNM